MSVAEGTCDWCGMGHLMETGDERSLVQFGKLWCGGCRAGSKDRYAHLESKWLERQIEIIAELLEQHPLQWEAPYDHFRMHLFKLDNADEQYRMQWELAFRSEEE